MLPLIHFARVHQTQDKGPESPTTMSVLYLTTMENIFLSGVIKSQVFDLVRSLRTRHGVPIHVLSFVPLHNTLRHRSGRRELTENLSDHGITLTVHPILLRSRVYLTPSQLRLLRLQCLRRLRKAAEDLDVRLVHARGYPSAHLAATVGLPFLFDGRGLYRLEALRTGSWPENSAAARFWVSEEKRLVARSESVVGVSPFFKEVFPSEKTTVIPCFATDHEEGESLPVSIQRFLSENRVLIYSGSLTSWYTPGPLFKAFDNLVRTTSWKGLVLTSDLRDAEKHRRELNLMSQQLMVARLAQEQVPQALRLASAAIWAAFDEDDQLYASQLGVKFAEYAAAGIPIVVTRNLRQAAALVERYQAGIVLDSHSGDSLSDALRRHEPNLGSMAQNARKMFEDQFTLEAASRAYAEVYERIRN